MATILGVFLVVIGAAILMRRFRRKPNSECQNNKQSAARTMKPSAFDISRPAPEVESMGDAASQSDDVNPDTKPQPIRPKTGRVMALSVMASPGTVYEGYELLQALLSNGMRFGERDIFHRYLGSPGSGQVLFSLASVKKPGTFDLTKMGEFKTSGLMLFLQVDQTEDPAAAFHLMSQTALQISRSLGGAVCDENRQPVGDAALVEMREDLMNCLS